MPKLGRRTEHQQVQQYYYNNNPPISYAPFGNEYTPMVKNKIVAGRLQPVLERRINPQGGVSPRSYYPHVVEPIAPKPNHVDPQLLKDYTQKLQSVNREFETISKPTTYGKRPDSKDLGQRYFNLPPIDQNKSRMQTSTIFEPESWTNYYRMMRERELAQQQQDGRFNPNDISNGYQNTGYGANGVTNGSQSPILFEPSEQQQQMPLDRHMKDSHREPPKRIFTQDDEDQYRLMEMTRMLPPDPELPEHPINLTLEEQEFLLMQARKELSKSNSNRLKEVYLDITENYDRTLSQWCHYSNLFKSLHDAQFRMSSDLQRLIASMFVSPSHLQEVNYEKFLSFIGTALTDSQGNSWPLELYSPRAGLEAQGQTNQYYRSQNNTCRSPRQTRPASPPTERDVTKLMKMTEQQLDDSDIDFEALVSRFQRYDREMRETLSADQIKGVLVKSGIGLQDSVINKILDKCGTTDGQYNWLKFVEFLEKTGQKAKTGLPIPRSKRPLEYAKQVPSPVPQWPHAATNEPPMEPVAPLWKNEERESPEYFQRPLYDPEERELTENKKIIDKMDLKLRHLETEYEDMKTKLHSPKNSFWFNLFMTFADELYAQDTQNSGYLPEQEVVNYTKSANNSYNLGIPDSAIYDTIRNTCSHGRVNIHSYLTRLKQRDW